MASAPQLSPQVSQLNFMTWYAIPASADLTHLVQHRMQSKPVTEALSGTLGCHQHQQCHMYDKRPTPAGSICTALISMHAMCAHAPEIVRSLRPGLPPKFLCSGHASAVRPVCMPCLLHCYTKLCVALQPCIQGQTFSNSSLYYQTNQSTDANFTITLSNGVGVSICLSPFVAVMSRAALLVKQYMRTCPPASGSQEYIHVSLGNCATSRLHG